MTEGQPRGAKLLQPSDSEQPVEIELKYVSGNTHLWTLLTGNTQVGIEKTASGAIVTASTASALSALKRYLYEGRLPTDETEAIEAIKALDYYQIVTVTAEYPLEFMVIKLEEDWFRKNLYSPNSTPELRARTYGCIQLTNEILKTHELARLVHYLYSKSIHEKTHRHKFDPSTLIEKDRAPLEADENEDDVVAEKERFLVHTYPRLYVKFTEVSQIKAKIVEANAKFRERDAEFDESCVRESLRKRRGTCKFPYDMKGDYPDMTSKSISVNWTPSLKRIERRFTTSQFGRIVAGMPNFWDGCLLAGGSVLNLIIGCHLETDYDLFFYGCTEAEATEKVREICQHVSCFGDVEVTRTENSVTISLMEDWHHPLKIQCILRLYASVSEVLHGFDVDCSCVGYDGREFWMTKRSAYAIKHMINFLDLDRASPTYEFRLAKYMSRGFSVYVPGFKWGMVRKELICRYHQMKRKFLKRETQLELEFRSRVTDEEDEDKVGDRVKRRVRVPSEEEQREHEARVAALRAEFKAGCPPLRGLEILIYSYYGFHLAQKYVSDYAIHAVVDRSFKTKGVKLRVNYQEEVVSFSVDGRHIDEIFDLSVASNRVVKIPHKLTWKTTNPGEQFTSTFHRLVVQNPKLWYQCRFLVDNPRQLYPTPDGCR